MIIKFRLRKNLLYLFVYYISFIIVNYIVDITLAVVFEFEHFYIDLYAISIGNIVGGFVIFLYQRNTVKKNEKVKYFALNLMQKKKKKSIIVGKFKQIVLMLIASFFNVYDFFCASNYYIRYVSWTQQFIFPSVQLISSTLICAYSLGFKIKKHHKFSLIITSVCLLIYYLLDPLLYYQYISKIQSRHMLFSYFVVIFNQLCKSLNSCIEKYLVNSYFVSPFIILMFEGVFELIMVLVLTNGDNPFVGFKYIFETFSTGYLVLFVILVAFDIIFQIIVAIYKIYCNVEYSPMASSFVYYAMSPFLFIYFFIVERGYYYTALYFIAVELICIFISFSGCVFNEYIILYFCGLEHETQDLIADRAEDSGNMDLMKEKELYDIKDDIDESQRGSKISFYSYNIKI